MEGMPAGVDFSSRKDRVWRFLKDEPVLSGTVGVSTAHVLYQMARIDPEVLDAIDTVLEPGVINDYSELTAHLSAVRATGENAWAGSESAYKGRLGEEYLAEELRTNGHVVVMAESTNQEGWDAIVDGQKVNFKAGLGEDHISEHLERYPEIPVITVAEQAEAFGSNPQVTSLSGVSGNEIENATESTMEGIVELGEIAGAIPIATMVLSSYRYFKPVVRGASDLKTATKYTVTDTVSIGGGAAAGVKIGAVLGVPGGPILVGAGAIAGGLVGALAGRLASKRIKGRSLREAKANLDEALTELSESYKIGISQKAEHLLSLGRRLQPRLNLKRSFWPTSSDVLKQKLSAAYSSWGRSCSKYHKQIGGQSDDNVARQLAEASTAEPVYSNRLSRAAALASEAFNQVELESRKLGH